MVEPEYKKMDKGIALFVKILRDGGIETYESCEGGLGHSFPEPTIRLHGQISEGFKVLDIALKYGLPVSKIRRCWSVIDKEPVGPHWEIVFYKKATLAEYIARGLEGVLG